MDIQFVKNIYHWIIGWGCVVGNGFGGRKLKIIGVTGTDGKTTTSHLIYEILRNAGFKIALVSTVAAYIGDEEIDTGFHVTSPEPWHLQPLLKKIEKEGFTHLVLEVTSHGLDQNRFVGVKFYVGVITNITHEHLDYHRSFAKYREAKAKLVLNTQYSVLNRDDPSFAYLRGKSKGEVVAYGKTKIKVENPSLAGEYNLYNVGAAGAVAKIFKINKRLRDEVIRNFAGVPGRMEEIKLGQPFRVIVDFAHTPNALDQVLKALNAQRSAHKKIILVFGCAGLRDHTKRPIMGRIAKKLADVVIITAEDPRTESLDEIYRQITEGGGEFMREDDRQKAIQMAVNMAKLGDIVVATGKGHEKSMCLGKTEYPWSDREAVKKAIMKLPDLTIGVFCEGG